MKQYCLETDKTGQVIKLRSEKFKWTTTYEQCFNVLQKNRNDFLLKAKSATLMFCVVSIFGTFVLLGGL